VGVLLIHQRVEAFIGGSHTLMVK
jgi:hypothetical protein